MNDEIIAIYYAIVLVITLIIFVFLRSFTNKYKLDRLRPLLVLFIVLPMFTKTSFSSGKSIAPILAIILVIYAIWKTIMNYKKDKGNSNPE